MYKTLIRATVIGGLLLTPMTLIAANTNQAKVQSPTVLAQYYHGSRTYYVCYRSRHTGATHSGHRVLVYKGCFRSVNSCGYNNSYHFGRYSSYQVASGGLNRCLAGTPRHVD